MIQYDPKLVKMYDDFIEGLKAAYPNAAASDLLPAEQFFELMEQLEDAELHEPHVRDVEELLADIDEESEFTIVELIEALGYEVAVEDDGSFQAAPRAQLYDA